MQTLICCVERLVQSCQKRYLEAPIPHFKRCLIHVASWTIVNKLIYHYYYCSCCYYCYCYCYCYYHYYYYYYHYYHYYYY